MQFQNTIVVLQGGVQNMVNENMVSINFTLPEELKVACEKGAKELNISRNAYMRIAISKMLKEG